MPLSLYCLPSEYQTSAKIQDELWALSWLQGVTNSHQGLTRAKEIYEQSGREDVKVGDKRLKWLSVKMVIAEKTQTRDKRRVGTKRGDRVKQIFGV